MDVGKVNRAIALRLSQHTYEEALRAGIPVTEAVRLSPKATSIRIAARDVGSGNAGSVIIRVQEITP